MAVTRELREQLYEQMSDTGVAWVLERHLNPRVEALLRLYRRSLFEQIYRWRSANYPDDQLVLLLPETLLSEEDCAGTFCGIRTRAAGVDVAVLGVELEARVER